MKLETTISRIDFLEHEVSILKSRISTLEDAGITVREAFGILDNFLVEEILTSKRAMKAFGIYTLHELFASPSHVKQCATFLKTHGLTEDHILLVTYFKEVGNSTVHPISKHDWSNMLKEEDDECEDIKMKEDLLSLLTDYGILGNSVHKH